MKFLSEKTISENYIEAEPWEEHRIAAKPVRMCSTDGLFREYRELEDAWEGGEGDEEALEKRMKEIYRELSRREGVAKR